MAIAINNGKLNARKRSKVKLQRLYKLLCTLLAFSLITMLCSPDAINNRVSNACKTSSTCIKIVPKFAKLLVKKSH